MIFVSNKYMLMFNKCLLRIIQINIYLQFNIFISLFNLKFTFQFKIFQYIDFIWM